MINTNDVEMDRETSGNDKNKKNDDDSINYAFIMGVISVMLFLSSVYAIASGVIKYQLEKQHYKNDITNLNYKILQHQQNMDDKNELMTNITANISIIKSELEEVTKKYDNYNGKLHALYEYDFIRHVNQNGFELYKLKVVPWHFRNSIKNDKAFNYDIEYPNGNLKETKEYIKKTLERQYPMSLGSFTGVKMELLDHIRSILPRYYHIHYCSTLKNDSSIFDESDTYNTFNIIIYNKNELKLNKKGSFNINVLPKNGSNLPDTGCVAWTQFGLNKMYNKDLVFLSTHIDSYPGLNKNDESTLTDEDKLLELITQLSVGNNNTKMDNTQECDNIYLHENPLTTIKNFVDEYVNKNSITTKRTYTIMSSDWNKISCKNNWNNNDPDYTLYKNTNIDDDWVDLKTLCYGCEKRLIDDEDDDELQPNNGECNGKHIQWPFMLDGYTKTRVLSYTVDNTPSAIKSDVDGIPVSLELQLLS